MAWSFEMESSTPHLSDAPPVSTPGVQQRGAANLRRPIFIVGSGRSGTTILYHMLCGHPELSWFSNYNQRWPASFPLAALSRFYRYTALKSWRGKGLPMPSEAYAVWDWIRPVHDSPCDPPLQESDVTPAERARARLAVQRAMFYQRKTRFLNKNTRNTRRLRYLNELFGDALFIHVIRDPRAAIASFLHVPWWPDLRVWCAGNLTPKQWAAQGGDPVLLAAELWRAEVQQALAAGAMLGEQRYLEVRYEEFMQTPDRVLARMLEFCGLPWTNSFNRFLDSFKLENRNFKFKKQFSATQMKHIENMVAGLAEQLQYDLG